MISIYTHAKTLAQAIADSVSVKNFCIQHFNRGCLVQLDDKAEDPISSEECPWVVVLVSTPGDLSAASADSRMTLSIFAGVCAPDAAATVTYTRSATANGYQILGIGERAEELLRLAIAACKAANLGAAVSIKAVDPRVDASSFFPLQVASANLVVAEEQNLSTFA